MKIYIPNIQDGQIGGGWTFTRNFIDLVPELLTDSVHEADIYFITGATLVKRVEVEFVKEKSEAKVVLRTDGIPEDWRNRGTGWSRLRDYAQMADGIIYQSHFTQKTTGRLVKRNDGVVIYNGVDTTVFNETGGTLFPKKEQSIVYINYRKGENNKRVEETVERFRQYKIDHPEAKITFVGNFSKQQFLWDKKNWDFGMLDGTRGHDWQYLGIVSDRQELAGIMRSNEYIAFPSFADPCPNTLIEAMACGCKPKWINDYGGQADIVRRWEQLDWSRDRMVKEYVNYFKEVLSK